MKIHSHLEIRFSCDFNLRLETFTGECENRCGPQVSEMVYMHFVQFSVVICAFGISIYKRGCRHGL